MTGDNHPALVSPETLSAIYEPEIERMLRPSPLLKLLRDEQAAKWAALPWHRKARIRARRRVNAARIRLSQAIYRWGDD